MSIDWGIAQPMPNYFAQFAQARAMGEQRRDRNALRELAPAALQGDQAAIDQVTAIDPARGQQFEQAAEAKARKLRGAAMYVKRAIDSGDPAAVQAAYNGVSPFLQQVTGKPVPPFDPSHLEGIDTILAQTAYLDEAGKGGRVQSTYIDEQGNRVAIMADGRTTVLGRNAPNYKPFDTGDGVVGFDPLHNTATPTPVVRPGAPAPQLPAPPQGSNLDARYAETAQYMERNGVPPEKVAAWLASQPGMVAAGEGGSGGVAAPANAPGEQLRTVPKPAEVERLRLAREANARAEEANRRAAEAGDRAARVEARGGPPPSGWRYNAAGELEKIPGYVPPNQSKPPTEAERGAAGYLDRMTNAERELGAVVAAGYDAGNLRDKATAGNGLLNFLASDQGQQYRQQQEDWVRAKLRKESGAVIGDEEMEREIKTYFPQPGDKPAVIANKKKSRDIAISAMRKNAGRAISEDDVAGGYTVGQVIEHGGKRYRVTDVTDPNDPDLEEVR